MEQPPCLHLYLFLSKEKTKDNNLNNYRLKLIFLALCLLFLLAIKRHISLGYVPELEQKNIAVSFDYYGAFENEVEPLVAHIEEAYLELGGIKSIDSVSEPGRGYILCSFSDKTSLDEAYVQISDITAQVWSDFPEGINRPVITKSTKDDYPVYISYFALDKVPYADRIKEAYEAVLGAGEVQAGSREKKELMIELHTGRTAGMALSSQGLDSQLRSSNLAGKVAMPGGQTLVFSSRFSSAADYGKVQLAPDLRLADVADIGYQDAESRSIGHINGKPALLFFVKKSGEGDTVRLCRELDAVTSRFGGTQFLSLGNKIEKSFIFSSSTLFLLFIFLVFVLCFKTKNFYLAAQAAGCSIVALLASVASVSTAGFQLDMTAMAALFLVVVFSFNVSFLNNRKGRNVNLFIILSTLIIPLYTPVHLRNLVLPFCIALASGCSASALFLVFAKKQASAFFPIPLWCLSPVLLFALGFLYFSPSSPFASDVNFSLEYESGTSFPFIKQSALDIESTLLDWNGFDRLTLHIDQGRASFTVMGGKRGEVMAKIEELSSRYPEIFFYIPEKHTKRAVDVTVYGNDVPEIKNNVLQLAKYVNESADNVNIIYNFKSDVTNIVLEIPVKCASSGFYPYDLYKILYYTVSEPVVDKFFAGGVETDVKIRGSAEYRKTLSGLLSVPVVSQGGAAGEAGDYIHVRRELAQGRIYHKNRMRVLSFAVTGISRAELRQLVSTFPFTDSCHGEVGQ